LAAGWLIGRLESSLGQDVVVRRSSSNGNGAGSAWLVMASRLISLVATSVRHSACASAGGALRLSIAASRSVPSLPKLLGESAIIGDQQSRGKGSWRCAARRRTKTQLDRVFIINLPSSASISTNYLIMGLAGRAKSERTFVGGDRVPQRSAKATGASVRSSSGRAIIAESKNAREGSREEVAPMPGYSR
jgi:hypothetical protein